jgi:type I restriction enzyme, S subunit
MNNETMMLLDKHFDTAFAASNGIKKLRELILTLAMQGELVPQDPNDEPASELLKSIELEKQQLGKNGKAKTSKSLPNINRSEIRYELPKGWEWVRLNDFGIWKSGSTPSRTNSSYYGGGISWVKSGEVKQGRIFATEETITLQALESCSLELNPIGSVLMAMYGANIGEVCILEIEATTNQAVCACKPYSLIDKNFLSYLLISLKQNFISQGAGAAQPNISKEKIIHTLVPLSPLTEQRRIVVEIDRLMARCDELEKLRADRSQKLLTVHTAALDKLLKAKESSDFSTAWHFITQNFSELYTVKENVAELHKAILQLAVMGKLVPQNPNDEPASELLKLIELEKQRLVKEGKIKQPKPLLEIQREEMPCELPKGWQWVRLGELALFSDSGWSPQCLSESRSGQEWGVLKVSAVSWGEFRPEENKALPQGMQPKLECEVQVGDFLISRANTEELVARSVVVKIAPIHLMMSDKIVRFNLSQKIEKDFINFANLSRFAREYYARNASGTSSSMKNISREVINNLPILLPPLAEQHRIVAEIDRLMALCDRLEELIEAAKGKQTDLLNALMSQV